MGIKTGIFKGEVYRVCPTVEEYNNIPGVRRVKHIDYSEPNGVKIVVVMLSDSDVLFVTFNLERRNLITKKGKTFFINSRGICRPFFEEDIPLWFSSHKYRKAFSGEPEMYEFLRTCLGRDVFLDVEKLFNQDFSEINSYGLGSVGCLATVSVNNEGKAKQSVYNKKFFPAKDYSKVVMSYSPKDIEELQEQHAINYDSEAPADRKRFLEPWEEFLIKLHDKKFPIPDYFTISELIDYNPENNPIDENNKALVNGSN